MSQSTPEIDYAEQSARLSARRRAIAARLQVSFPAQRVQIADYGRFDVEIDYDDLADVLMRARNNKGGRSKDGPFIVNYKGQTV